MCWLLYKVDDFRKHENGVDHKFAVQARACREGAYMQKAAGTAYQMIKEAIVATMKNVYYLAQGDFAKEKLQSLNEHTQIMVFILSSKIVSAIHSLLSDWPKILVTKPRSWTLSVVGMQSTGHPDSWSACDLY